jgi:signal transduction histidine kinase
MKKYIFCGLFILSFNIHLFAQKHGKALVDSLKIDLLKLKNDDSTKVKLINNISFALYSINPNEGILFGNQALQLAQKIKWKTGEARANSCIGTNYYSQSNNQKVLEYYTKALKIYKEINDKSGTAKVLGNIGNVYRRQSNAALALDYYMNALQLYELINDKSGIAAIHGNIGIVYQVQHDFTKALAYYFKCLKVNQELGDKYDIAVSNGNIAMIYKEMKFYDKALIYGNNALRLNQELGDNRGVARSLGNIGSVYAALSEYEKALQYFEKSVQLFEQIGDKKGLSINIGSIGNVYYLIATDTNKKILDKLFQGNKVNALLKAKFYTDSSILIATKIGDLENLIKRYEYMSDIEDLLGNQKEALLYYKLYAEVKDSVYNEENNKKISNLEAKRIEDLNQKQLELKDLQIEKTKNKTLSLLIGIAVLLVFSILLVYYFLQKQKANKRITTAYNNLKITQGQLVQSEKMASLGQMTAGVAHEINNPINFISSSIGSLNRDINDVKNLLNIYKTNPIEAEKFAQKIDIEFLLTEIDELIVGINAGAIRTSEIVKGLRNFSRVDEANKKKANINDSLESTLMILQSKITEKNCSLHKGYSQLPDVFCHPSQLNQMFMNIILNAIDAIEINSGSINIHTKLNAEFIFISIADNGNGIPKEIQQKIFDPFFTTKEVGKGIGLGLSIVHGIIENHNGKIEVNSEIGKGTEFIISLPIS